MRDGHAIHGSYEVKNLGKPLSHGCVRISPENAATLYALVAKNGLENTQVVLTGTTPGGEYKVASPARPGSRYSQAGYGKTPGDPLALFEVLCGAFVANVMAFNADVSREIAVHVLELAEKQSASFPRVLGHNHLGGSLMLRGQIAEARPHLDQAAALYDGAEQRSLATRFGEDQGVATLSMRPWVLWLLGYPEAALRDTDDALKNARETGQAASLMFALHFTAVPLILCGDYARPAALARELCALADEKNLPFWKVNGSLYQGSLFALTGNASEAVQLIASGITAVRPTGVTAWMPRWLSYLAIAHADLDQIDDAWRCIGEAISMTEAIRQLNFTRMPPSPIAPAAEQHGKSDHVKGKEHSTSAQQHSQNARQRSEQAHTKSQQQK